jgi:hypothetical protein
MVTSQITEAPIKREDHAATRNGRLHNVRIGRASQTLLLDRVRIVTGGSQDPRGGFRQILVDLDLHCEAASGRMSSRASSAA